VNGQGRRELLKDFLLPVKTRLDDSLAELQRRDYELQLGIDLRAGGREELAIPLIERFVRTRSGG
jgi:hypothetical protein